MKSVRVIIFALCLTVNFLLAGCGGNVNFSNMDVTCIVPFDAGGGTDAVMRGLADAAASSFKSITVENRPGAGGAIGMLYGAGATRDGSIITMITSELVTLEANGNNYGMTHSMFRPIMLINTAAAAVTVKANDSRFNTLEDFIEYSKKNEVTVGNSGTGAIWHFAAAGLAKAAETQFAYASYDGANGAIRDLIAGNIDAVSVSYAEVSASVKSGDLKVLAIMSNERLVSIPDVPTCKECGYNASLGTWRGLGVPASTPDETVNALYRIFYSAANSDSFRTFMSETNNVIEILDGQQFNNMIENQLDLFTELADNLGLRD